MQLLLKLGDLGSNPLTLNRNDEINGRKGLGSPIFKHTSYQSVLFYCVWVRDFSFFSLLDRSWCQNCRQLWTWNNGMSHVRVQVSQTKTHKQTSRFWRKSNNSTYLGSIKTVLDPWSKLLEETVPAIWWGQPALPLWGIFVYLHSQQRCLVDWICSLDGSILPTRDSR